MSKVEPQRQAMTTASRDASRPYDLEERTFLFARDMRAFVRALPRTPSNRQDVDQLVRSSGSVGANYIEANEALSRKDYYYRVKVCRKEVKETLYWLRLVDCGNSRELTDHRDRLESEAGELMRIFGAIIRRNAPQEGEQSHD